MGHDIDKGFHFFILARQFSRTPFEHGVRRRQFRRPFPHPLFKRELCGADAQASFNREEFGLDMGRDYGFKMDVNLRIQVEAIALK